MGLRNLIFSPFWQEVIKKHPGLKGKDTVKRLSLVLALCWLVTGKRQAVGLALGPAAALSQSLLTDPTGALSCSPMERHFLSEDQDSPVPAALGFPCWLLGRVFKPFGVKSLLLVRVQTENGSSCCKHRGAFRAASLNISQQHSSLEHCCAATSCPISHGFYLQTQRRGK